MKKEICGVCGKKINEKNDGLFVLKEILSLDELLKLDKMKKPICVDCKRELMVAGIWAVI